MTLSEYKERGILEAYVLGVLDPGTIEMLESDLETNIALKEELEKVEKTLENFKSNFTKGQKKRTGSIPQSKKRTGRTTAEKSIRIILGVLVLVMVVMIFLFLSTIYENNNFRKAVIEQALTIDSLNNEIRKTYDLNDAFKLGITELSKGTASIINFIGAGSFTEKSAYLVVPENRSSADFLVIQSPELPEEDFYLQLWSESGGQFRRVGRVSIPQIDENWIVHSLPRTNLQLSHISLETGTPPSQPTEENLVFFLNTR